MRDLRRDVAWNASIHARTDLLETARNHEPIPAWKPGAWRGGGMGLLKRRALDRKHLREILALDAGK